jgi:hypothetical protein
VPRVRGRVDFSRSASILLELQSLYAVMTERTASTFSDFAGSTENATSLVTGLRTGGEVQLTAPEGANGAETVAFTPPTGRMGYGNVHNALGLAQHQLSGYGIDQPTPEQIQAALVGGEIHVDGETVVLDGVLQMRADGMGWGEIANAMGTRLGHVVSATRTGRTVAPEVAGAHAPGNAVTTAAGGTPPAHGANDRSGAASRPGIVTGLGTSFAQSGGVAARGKGHAYGRGGIVTATGSTPGAAAAAGAQGRSGIVTGAGVGVPAAAAAGHGRAHGLGAGVTHAGGGGAAAGGGHGRGLARGHR